LDKGDFVFALPKASASTPAVAGSNATTPPRAQPAPTRVDPAQQELTFWNSIQNSSDPEDFKDYLEKYGNGLYAGIARRKLAALTTAVRPAPATPTSGGTAAPNTTTGASLPASPKPGSVTRTRSGIELAYVPPGEFMMGSEKFGTDAQPVHRVTIRKGFWMGKHEVTQAQWQAVMGNNPSHFKGDTLPVENVSWNDAQAFIQKLNEQNDGFSYRLPSEAEWEYAARAGTTGDYAGNLDAMAWHSANSGGKTHPVGEKQANEFGLHDMLGNVLEWCEDYSQEHYNGAPSDGSAWLSDGDTEYRVMRGGSWNLTVLYLHAAGRGSDAPSGRSNFQGFRVVAVART
jgi:formylglycine-generating enzyme required for sulfatase activity